MQEYEKTIADMIGNCAAFLKYVASIMVWEDGSRSRIPVPLSTISRISFSFPIPYLYPNFPLPQARSSEIPYPLKISRNLVLYSGQIPDPWNNLRDPVVFVYIVWVF